MIALDWNILIIGMVQAFMNACAVALAGYLIAKAISRLDGKKKSEDGK